MLSLLEAASNFDTEVNVDSKKDDNISSWNRPTIGWSLTCESEGKTRQQAYNTVNLSLESSEKIPTIRKSGIAMCALYPIVFIWTIFVFLLACKEDEENFFNGLFLSYGVMRLLFVIMAPILGVAIYQVLDTNSDNFNAVADYTVVSSCMD